MAYVLPQVIVFQEFTSSPAAVINPLRAHISGGHAQLVRYNTPSEQASGFLGYYDNLLDASFTWPGREAGGLIDGPYTKVWIKNALLRYFATAVGAGKDVTRLTGYSNRVRAANLNFATHGDYLRSADLNDRDVRVGDVVKARGLDTDDVEQTTWAYVKALHGDTVAAVVDDATADTDNAADQIAATSITKTVGVLNGVILTPSGASYEGTPSGQINETYDIIVTQASVNEDDTKAVLRVISGSGTDDQVAVVPAARGVAFAIGTRGLTVTVSDDDLSSSSLSAEDAGIPYGELVVGHRWHIVVNQVFTHNTATAGGTYSGATDTTYIIRVSRGGTYAGTTKPQVTVTTTNGVDISGPTSVTAAATAVAAGTQGTTVAFSGTKLRKGDVFYIPVTAAAEGPMKVLELSSNLNAGISAGTELDLELYIRQPVLQVSQNQLSAPPLTNWDQSATELTLHAGITALDPTWTLDGVRLPLPVYSEASQLWGGAYAEYRAWLPELSSSVHGITDVGTIDTIIPGPLDPDNPLKWGVFKALESSNGTEVKFTAVADPDDDDSWADVLELMLGREDVYGLVPLTHRRTVLDLYAAHVLAQSAPEMADWRVAWFGLEGVPDVPVVATGSLVPNHTAATTVDGEACLCTVTDDPLTSGTQYTILKCTSGNSAFITNGARAGDIVRTLYTGDGFGNYSYSEFVVDAVTSEDELRLLAGPDAAVNVGAQTEVWRHLTPDEEAAEIARAAGSWGSQRIRAIWPDLIESSGTVMAGFFLCASLAGEASGILPHQGMTRLQITGYSSVPRTTSKFSRTQLDLMGGSGVWIVTQDIVTGTIYTRQAVTTADYNNINLREEMVCRNVDSISFRFKDHFAPFIGVTNVTPQMVTRIGTEVKNLVGTLQTELATLNLGGQLIDGTVISLRQHLTLKDRIVLTMALTVPFSLNVLEIHLTI